MAEKALEGFRVLYLGIGIAGPFAQRYLAGLGAEVIRVQAGSRIRQEGAGGLPFDPKRGLTIDFPGTGDLMGGYLDVGLELKDPRGLEVFNQLLKKSDAVVVSYATSVPPKLGIDYESLKKVKEDIVMIHTPSMGTTGPYCNYDLWGANVSPMTGISKMIGYPDLPEPEGLAYGGSTLTDFISGYTAAMAVLMALYYRQRTGKGQFIDLSMMEVTVGAIGPQVLDFVANGVSAGRRGNRNPYFAPHGTYRCKGDDRWCSIAVRAEEEWPGFCRALENPSLAIDSRFETLSKRLENQDELDRIIEEFTSKIDPYEVMFRMQHEGVAAGVVQTSDDLILRDLQLQAREFWVKPSAEKRGDSWTYGIPLKMSATPPKLPRGHAVLSQDNDYVLKDLLGMSDEQVAKLIEEGVVNAPIPGDPSLKNRSLSQRWTGRLGSSLPRADELKWGN